MPPRYVGALKGHLSGVQEERSRKASQGLNPDAGIAASTRWPGGNHPPTESRAFSWILFLFAEYSKETSKVESECPVSV